MLKTNFYASVLTGLFAVLYIINELNNDTLVFTLSISYSLLLILVGEFIGFTTALNIQNKIFKRTEEEATQRHLPEIPFQIKRLFIFLPINLALLLVMVAATYYVVGENASANWYMALFFPILLHLLSLIPFFLFLDPQAVQTRKKIFDEDDRHTVVVNIGKKLANKESKSCRKTNTNEFQTLSYYLDTGLDPNEVFEERYTLLLPGTCCGDLKLAKLLIGHGSNVNVKSALGVTPLHLAAQHDSIELVKLLIENGADKEIVDSDGKTPLYYAKKEGFKDIVEILE